ncbi:hypothetical protein ACVWBO_23595 [Escherichia coli]
MNSNVLTQIIVTRHNFEDILLFISCSHYTSICPYMEAVKGFMMYRAKRQAIGNFTRATMLFPFYMCRFQ